MFNTAINQILELFTSVVYSCIPFSFTSRMRYSDLAIQIIKCFNLVLSIPTDFANTFANEVFI